MKKEKKIDTKEVRSTNKNIRSSVKKLKPILKSIVGKKVNLALRDLSFSEKTIDAINKIHDFPTIFIDDSFEICGIASEINKYIPKENLVKPLCRVSKNVPFAEHLEADVIVSKKRVKEVLTNLSK